ncbi:transmembrane protein, putative [Medicago truncatula]|uniref:Transmembrane protein, putative n=1 Tax=Medicago truncatula TaxID=3880 RepID=A0A072VRV3_MEDTR|nr:transmembrane protein, putative [Medicago truncatula]
MDWIWGRLDLNQVRILLKFIVPTLLLEVLLTTIEFYLFDDANNSLTLTRYKVGLDVEAQIGSTKPNKECRLAQPRYKDHNIFAPLKRMGFN